MAALVITAIVVRTQEYRDKDRLVSLLSADCGRIDAVARGAKASFKRFGGHLEPFTVVEAVVNLRPGLSGLNSVSAQQSWPHLRQDLVAIALASYLAEIAWLTSAEGHADPHNFAWLQGALAHIDAKAGQPASAWSQFVEGAERECLHLHGWLPAQHLCGHCCAALPPEAPSWLGVPELLAYCALCRRAVSRAVPVPVEPASAAVAARRRAYATCLEHHLGKRPRTLSFLDSLLAQGSLAASLASGDRS